MSEHILRVDSTDQKGLVHAITGVLCRHGCNITSNGEFVDRERGHFFMRTEFSGDFDPAEGGRELAEVLPGGANVRFAEKRDKDILVLATKEPHCLGDLLIRHAAHELKANILGVISNHDTLGEIVERFAVPFHYVPHEGLARRGHEEALAEIIDACKPDYVVLAKYMRIFTPTFVACYRNRIINIHHSFLPAFMGANPYRQAFERGVKIIGATAHFVSDDLDQGPIIRQEVIPIDHTYAPQDMMQAGRDVEKVVLAHALKLVFEERVFINGNKTVIFE